MYGTVQQLFQVTPKAGLLEEPSLPLHVDEQIEIAFWSGLSSGDRSEHLHPAGAMKGGHSLDFVAPLTQLLHSWHQARRARVWIRLAVAVDSASKLAKSPQRRILVLRLVTHFSQSNACRG